MSSWDTNLRDNFCDPHWELICHNKWHSGTSEIFTLLEIAVGSLFHVWHGTKTTSVFLPANREPSWLLLPSLVSLLSGSTVQSGNTYSCILKVQVRFEKAKKASTLITATTNVHLPKPVSTDLTIKSDSVLTNPIWKDGVHGRSM